MATSKYTSKDIQRFWSKVAITANPGLCWEWVGTRKETGYGIIGIGNKTLRSHRVAYELTHGEIPDGLKVLHECDNPPCCNPAHLFLGTQIDNNKDMCEKKRQSEGETQGHHKLTVEKVLSIRLRYAAGGISQRQLAIEMDVVPTTIRDVLRRKTWKSVI